MSLIYFTPGPSALHPLYNQFHQEAMEQQLGSINHRSDDFRGIYAYTDRQLRTLMNIPETHAIYFCGSATEIWERLLMNCVEAYSYHLVNGSFSSRFYEYAKALNKKPHLVKVPAGQGFELEHLDIPDNIEMICTTQNETSTGVQVPAEDLEYLKDRYPDKLLCTDLVSSAPYAQIDFQKIDSAFFSVQKAFGMPPGLGVWIVNKTCHQKSHYLKEKGCCIGAHHTLDILAANYKKFETASTPAVISIYILGRIAEDMNQTGIEVIRESLNKKASMIYQFAREKSKDCTFVTTEKHQSATVAVLNTVRPSDEIIDLMKKEGFVLGDGYGEGKSKQIRIANFPATDLKAMREMLYHLGRVW